MNTEELENTVNQTLKLKESIDNVKDSQKKVDHALNEVLLSLSNQCILLMNEKADNKRN